MTNPSAQTTPAAAPVLKVDKTVFNHDETTFVFSDGSEVKATYTSRANVDGDHFFYWPGSMAKHVVWGVNFAQISAIEECMAEIWESIYQAEDEAREEAWQRETSQIMETVTRLQRDVMITRLKALDSLKQFLASMGRDCRFKEFAAML